MLKLTQVGEGGGGGGGGLLYSKFGYDPLSTGESEILLTNCFVLRSQQVLISIVNSHVMPFNFQYVLIHSFTLNLRCQISILAHCY